MDYKYPWWDGNWLTFEDYKTRVELRADASKEDELPFLGPRLAANLVGKAFETLGEISRTELKKPDGWQYLLTFLEKKRGRAKIDLLGDMFSEFFMKKEAYRRDQEEWNDYEVRFRALVRKTDRAVKDANTEAAIPSELYGWFLLNLFMRLAPSDAANIRGRAGSYKMDDVMQAIKVMWGSGGLATRDHEMKSRSGGTGKAYTLDDVAQSEENEDEHTVLEVDEEMDELQAWHDDALAAFAEDPVDSEILANFREARKALDQARTSRGFFPVRQPKGKGKTYGKTYTSGKGGSSRPSGPLPSHADKICMRCGKKGHIAQFCPQRPGAKGSHGSIGFVGLVACEKSVQPESMDLHDPEWQSSPDASQPWSFEEDVSEYFAEMDMTHQASVFAATGVHHTCSMEDCVPVFALGPHTRGCAIIDSGASDNIVGAETLQELADCLGELDFAPDQEITIDRAVHKQFVFGNNERSAGLGLSHVNAGMCGQQVSIQAHLVEGGTPFLLSSKFLYDMDATINFRTGKAIFKKISPQQFQLERTPSHHLMMPLTAFAGNTAVMKNVFLQHGEEDLSVAQLSDESDSVFAAHDSPQETVSPEVPGERGDPCK